MTAGPGSIGLRPDELVEGLTDTQRRAVEHRGSPLLVVAGAGSGKTRVLTRRIAHLIATRDAAPWQILAITFTNKAADEMRGRVAELVGDHARRMWVSTFHSACVRILRSHGDRLGYRGGFTIYDALDSRRLVDLVCRELDIDTKRLPARAILGQISSAKSRQLTPEEFLAEAGSIIDRKVAEVYARYQERLLAANAMDFDDLLFQTVRLFESEPDVLEHFRQRFTHVLIDEYQDTNTVQNTLAVMLAGGHRNICVVGDSDQSVYRFRGADITNILEFEEAFPDATTITLEQNFRSTQTILDAANAVIANNRSRRPKQLWTDRGAGERIVRYRAEDEVDEAAWVASEIRRLHDDAHLSWGDVAVFYRTNAQSRAIEEGLVAAEIPYRVVGGTRFYDRKEVRDVLAYLRVLVNPDDEVSWRRAVNVPKRGVGETTVAKLAAWAAAHGVGFGEAVGRAGEAGVSGKALAGLAALDDLLGDLRERMAVPELHVDADGVIDELVEPAPLAAVFAGLGGGPASAPGRDAGGGAPTAGEGDRPLRPDEVVREVVARSGMRTELLGDGTIEALGRVENVDELAGVAGAYATVADFLEAASLVADSDEAGGDGTKVSLMTLHIAKGLEFPAVFMVGMEDGVFPHFRSLGDPVELEEERRLCYVGITRAQRHLAVSHAWSRTLWGATSSNMASRFLAELPEELVADARSTWGPSARSALSATVRSRGRRAWDDEPLGTPGRGSFGTGRAAEPRVAAGSGAELLGLVAGDRVVHAKWGEGVVIATSGSGEDAVATVEFPGFDPKKLLLRVAPVKRA